MKDTRITKPCAVCDNIYKVKAYRAEASKFCSKLCWANRSSQVPARNCLGCEISFTPIMNRQKTCSLKCAGIARSGANHFRWKGGTSKTERERQQTDIARWRKSVFTRDKYTCQHCGDRKNLNAHHVKEWANFPDDRFDIANGLTLCESCHGKVHGKDFSNRRVKHCSLCFESTSGRSLYCHPCATRIQWQRQKHQRQIQLF